MNSNELKLVLYIFSIICILFASTTNGKISLNSLYILVIILSIKPFFDLLAQVIKDRKQQKK